MKVEGMQVKVENSDNADGTKAADVWNFGDAVQAEKHLPQFEDGVNVRAEIKADGSMRYATEKIARGDASAIRDAANEFRKQRDS